MRGKGFGVRAAAYVIDAVVMAGTAFVLSFFFGLFLGIALAIAGREPVFEERSFWQNLPYGFANSLVYFAVFEWSFGATPGKLLLGLRVVMENGERCTVRAALVRGLIRFVDALFFAIPALVSMKPPLQQRIGDKAAGTIVVAAADVPPDLRRQWWWLLVAAIVFVGIAGISSIIQIVSALAYAGPSGIRSA